MRVKATSGLPCGGRLPSSLTWPSPIPAMRQPTWPGPLPHCAGTAVGVVAELGQDPGGQHQPKPRLAAHDPSIPMGTNGAGECGLQARQLLAQAGETTTGAVTT